VNPKDQGKLDVALRERNKGRARKYKPTGPETAKNGMRDHTWELPCKKLIGGGTRFHQQQTKKTKTKTGPEGEGEKPAVPKRRRKRASRIREATCRAFQNPREKWGECPAS